MTLLASSVKSEIWSTCAWLPMQWLQPVFMHKRLGHTFVCTLAFAIFVFGEIQIPHLDLLDRL